MKNQNTDQFPLSWWMANVKYGDPVSMIITVGELTEKRDMIYDRVESINLGMETADIVLFHESKDTLGDMNKVISFTVPEIHSIQSIRGVAYTPAEEVPVKPEKSKTKSESNAVSVSTTPVSTSGSKQLIQEELQTWDMKRKKIPLRMVVMARMMGRKNLKSEQYAKLCADIDNMIIYMGYSDRIDRLLDRLMVKKKLMERKSMRVDNLLIFSDGSVYVPASPPMSQEIAQKKKNQRSTTPAQENSGIYEKDGRFYCPCGKSYNTRYHAVYNHKQHMGKVKQD